MKGRRKYHLQQVLVFAKYFKVGNSSLAFMVFRESQESLVYFKQFLTHKVS